MIYAIVAIVSTLCFTFLYALDMHYSCKHKWKILWEEPITVTCRKSKGILGTQYVTKLCCEKCGYVELHVQNVKASSIL